MTASDKWHRTEPREVRPFFESLTAQSALDACGISLYADGEVSTETVIELDDIDFNKLSIAVSPTLPVAESWMGNTLRREDLELIVLLRHGFLKRSQIFRRIGLIGTLPSTIEIDTEALAPVGGGRNTQITVAICLVSDRPTRPGVPFLAGHWLARKTFTIRSRSTPNLFDLRTRTDKDWLAAGFPAKTYYSVDYQGGIDSDLEEGASVATVWIHSDAHAKLTTGTLGEAMQPLLASDIIAIILAESLPEWKDQLEAAPDSALSNLLDKLGGEAPMPLSELKALVSKPSSLRAFLQDRLSVLSAFR
ncbi:hypothetical protein [Rhizobium sp. Leaf383]|uniref:hypothetical protein n=1 Tax=Rhizobium sp. Leaf383 TaxID=1736357 RepID=UPI0007154C1A|nr:hypothetical protein [Rhizobium sp. Leaf383]KQS76373.1 hypothetical protein ASG58_11120 [Rhizobium sp. Leaf383]